MRESEVMTDFVEVKTQDLSGAALDWFVAKAGGFEPMLFPMSRTEVAISEGRRPDGSFSARACSYSTDWRQGGPLIEKYSVEFEWITDATIRAEVPACGSYGYGHKHLTAALRAIVASALGDTVSVPKELLS